MAATSILVRSLLKTGRADLVEYCVMKRFLLDLAALRWLLMRVKPRLGAWRMQAAPLACRMASPISKPRYDAGLSTGVFTSARVRRDCPLPTPWQTLLTFLLT